MGLWVFDFSDEPWLLNGSFIFYGYVGFHWVWDFSVDLSYSIVSLCCCELNFFVYISSMEQLQVAEKFCLLCYLWDQQPMCVCVS